MRTERILMGAVLLGGLACAQTTLLSTSPAGSGICVSSVVSSLSPEFAYLSWTTTTAYSNVTIAANLFALAGGQVTAYLSNSVGTGATAIATSSPVSVTSAQTNMTLFSGLTLPAGTYYLVLSGNMACGNTAIGWSYSTGSPTVGPGVTLGAFGYDSPFIGSPNASNPVASTFVTNPGASLSVLVMATSAPAPTATPIPPSLMLVVTGLAGLGIYQLRRRRQWGTA